MPPRDVDIEDVRSYWESHPVAAESVDSEFGTKEFFERYDALREQNEPLEFSYRLHEYRAFAGKRVLDVGCGNGYVLAKYAAEGADVDGIDLTPAAVEVSRRRFELLELEGRFQEASAEAIPFEDATFDCVCSMGVLHHTPNTELAVAELFRVLKPGGRLIVMFYHRDSVLYRVGLRLRSLLERKSIEQLVNEVDGIGNPRGDVYSRRELQTLLHCFGEIQMFTGLVQGWMVSARIGRVIPRHLLRRLETRWGWFLYAKARKPSSDGSPSRGHL